MRLAFVLMLIACVASTATVHAQGPCDSSCDRIVEPSVHVVDGASIAPGSMVCLRGGSAPTLSIHDVHGTADAPITVRACDAPLVLGGGTSQSGISIARSSFLRVTGETARAIRVVGGDSYSVGVSVSSCTEELEVDHLEVSGTSYTAYRNLSEDDSCAVRRGFSLHDWWIHDVGGEGMFFGSNAASTPYRLADVEVFGNRVERTGLQGIKIGRSVDLAHVHDNVVIDAGTRDVSGEDTGITGSATSYFIERNIVVRTSASCVFVSGEDVHLIDNVLAGCGQQGLATNGMAPMQIRVLHNTVIQPGAAAYAMWSSMPSDSAFANNLIVDLPDGSTLGIRDGGEWSVTGNLLTTMAEARFAHELAIETVVYDELEPALFALAPDSPAIDAAEAGFAAEVPTDVMGSTRDALPDVGAYEVVVALPGTDGGAPIPEDAGAVEVSPDGRVLRPDGGISSGPERGGCTIMHRGRQGGTALAVGVLFVCMWVAARGRRARPAKTVV